MKKDIHPKYTDATVTCSCGNTFKTRSTRPVITVQLCSRCHPFFTGKQKLVDSAGTVERFMRRYGKTAQVTPAAPGDAAPETPSTADIKGD